MLKKRAKTPKKKLYHYCPNCKKEITYLLENHLELVLYAGTVDFKGRFTKDCCFEAIDRFPHDEPDQEVRCPECVHPLSLDEVIKTDIKPKHFNRDYEFTQDFFPEKKKLQKKTRS